MIKDHIFGDRQTFFCSIRSVKQTTTKKRKMGILVGNFCYFLPLETGVIIIGCLELFIGFVFLVSASFTLLGGSILQAVVGILQGGKINTGVPSIWSPLKMSK